MHNILINNSSQLNMFWAIILPKTRWTGIINKPLLLHLVHCLYYLYDRKLFPPLLYLTQRDEKSSKG